MIRHKHKQSRRIVRNVRGEQDRRARPCDKRRHVVELDVVLAGVVALLVVLALPPLLLGL